MFWIPGAQSFGSQEDIEMDPRRTMFWIPGAQCFGSQEDSDLDPRGTVQLCQKIHTYACIHILEWGKPQWLEWGIDLAGKFGRCWRRLVEVERSLDTVWGSGRADFVAGMMGLKKTRTYLT